MERGQCSGTRAEDEAWARLVPSGSSFAEVDIMLQDTVIHSETICSSSEKQNWCIISRSSEQVPGSATIKNTSVGKIVVDGVIVYNGEIIDIKHGSKIISDSDNKECVHYTFEVLQQEKGGQKNLMISLDVEHSKCSICLNVWHDVVTVAPCLHNFCNGCFSEWLKRSQSNHKSVICPQCRAGTLSVGRNHFLHNIEEAIFLKFPLLKRPVEDLELLDKSATIQSNLVLGTKKTASRKRPSPISSAYNDSLNQCPQCASQMSGFSCNEGTAHLQCHYCGGMMPSRSDIDVPQCCMGCDRAFCGAYWHLQGVNSIQLSRMCSRDTFRPISERTISRIPDSAHQNNRYEQSITERCIQQTGKPIEALASEWVAKFCNREVDRTRLSLNHVETISAESHLCNECYQKLIGYLLYWFRVSIPKCLLPPEAVNREDCWYGYGCRTQHHNTEHAQKRNHVCRPTRGNPNAPL